MKRRTVGFFSGTLSTQYEFGLFRSMKNACEKLSFNLIHLVCGAMDCINPFPYEFQHNQLYFLLNEKKIDGLVLLPNLINHYAVNNHIRGIISNFPSVPIVTINGILPGYPSVLPDNVNGIRELVKHLYSRHSRKKIAFVSGPRGNKEAMQRLEGYRLGLESCGIPFDELYLYFGDFLFTGGIEASRRLFCGFFPPPDAVVCANDEMAQGCYKILKEKGLRIPEDVCVTGFDNLDGTEFFIPPLTSITQNFIQMTENAVEKLNCILEGREPNDITILDTEIVYRQSCGCTDTCENDKHLNDAPENKVKTELSARTTEDLRTRVQTIGTQLTLEHNLAMQHWMFALKLNNIQNKDDLEAFLLSDLPNLGVCGFYFVLFQNPFPHYFSDPWFRPPKSHLFFGFNRAGRMKLSEQENEFPTESLLPPFIKTENKQNNFLVMELFYREIQYGYLIYDTETGEPHSYEKITIQIAEAYHRITMLGEILDLKSKLETSIAEIAKLKKKD